MMLKLTGYLHGHPILVNPRNVLFYEGTENGTAIRLIGNTKIEVIESVQEVEQNFNFRGNIERTS